MLKDAIDEVAILLILKVFELRTASSAHAHSKGLSSLIHVGFEHFPLEGGLFASLRGSGCLQIVLKGLRLVVEVVTVEGKIVCALEED